MTDEDQLARLRYRRVKRLLGQAEQAQRSATSAEQARYANAATVAAQLADWMFATGQLHESAEATESARQLLDKREAARRSEHGKHAAEHRWDSEDRQALDSILRQLARQQDAIDYLDPSDLWPKLFSELEVADLAPQDHDHYYVYGDSQIITYESFRKSISRLRS